MSEVRVDPLTGLRAIIGDDPGFAGELAPGQPSLAPVDSGRALSEEAPDTAPEANRDLFWAAPALGAHERLESSPTPVSSLGELPDEGLAAMAERWRERMRAHGDAACLHLSVDEAGAAVPGGPGDGAAQPRTQLFALEFVPAAIARERERFGAYATRTMGGNLLADLVQEEVRRRERIVAIDEECVLMAPFGARAPYQLLLAPRRPRAAFESDGPTGARMLGGALRRLARRFGASPPLSLWIRTAPRGAEHFCWRIDVLPQLTRPGGLDLGTGVHFNPVAPERAAAELREI